KNKEIDNVVNTTSISEKEKHIKLVEKGVDTINNSVLKKVVLSRNEVVNKSFKNPLNVFKRLLQAYPEAFVYCWYHPKVGLWIGATPETLLQLENSQFKTMALAGTQKYLGTLDVNWQLKEQEEQQFVTNSIKKSLLPLVERLKIAERETVKAGNLLHLKTTISGTFNLQKVTIKKLLLSLHPTPAVCGLPKDKALQFIKENENYSREFYTGFLGELHFKETKTRNTNKRNVEQNAYNLVKKVSHLFVNLRCAKLQSSQAQIYVGGGITKDSVAENEWHETVNKAQTIKRIL
ncbi:MAG: chorismate-binding protein, partial [Oceanihabitans sp.]